jgi:colanic acid biosynthesis glycosyl transferase WcaI
LLAISTGLWPPISDFQLCDFSPVKFLFLNQTFYPDVMATAQYLTEVAVELAGRGHEVTVVASRRAYDRPETSFAKEETWRGIRICRVGTTGFGKGAKWRRAADFASFIALCSLRLAALPRHDVVVALTSPPLISFIGAWLAKIRRSRFVYWVMDFNPDEAIAAGWLAPGSLAARALDWMSRFSLKQATKIIALDRFMRDRITAKGIAPEKVTVIPPWSHDGAVQFDPGDRERFRQAHGLTGKFVVMYSGNHSPCHPLDTLLEAARRLAHDLRIVFCFVGGGSEFRKIQQLVSGQASLVSGQAPVVSGQSSEPDETPNSNLATGNVKARSSNILCLPYQPLHELSGSLSAADLHVVVMGDPFVGLIHPCKIYNVLAVGAPVLYIGPEPSHLSEILSSLGSHACASAKHDDVDRCVAQIVRMASLQQRGEPERYETIAKQFSQGSLLPALVSQLESNTETLKR